MNEVPISNLCLHNIVEEQVARTPNAVAVLFEGMELTYYELNRRASKLASFLRSQGAGPEVLIGIHLERSLDLVVSLLAVLKSGAAYVPLDLSYPADRLQFMLQEAAISIVIAKDRSLSTLGPIAAKSVCLDTDAMMIEACDETDSHCSGSEKLAYVIFTSGSTGTPKGAMNTHRGIVNRLEWMQRAYGLRNDDRVLQKTPFGFDVSVWEFFWPLMTGAKLVIAKPNGHRDRDYLAQIIRSQRITTIHFVPSMLRIFLEGLKSSESTASLRRIISSGEALSPDVMNRCQIQIPNAELHNLYGPTEAAVDVTAWQCRIDPEALSVPIGYPIDNIDIYILDNSLAKCEPGTIGEICIAGVGVANGYINRPDLTQDRFVLDPFTNGGRPMYRTGDLGYRREDGAIEFAGRSDYQVKVYGNRIELGEIEAILTLHPAIKSSVVILQGSDLDGPILTAFIIVDKEEDITDANIREHLARRLPAYMLPKSFIRCVEFPISINGKVDRKTLASYPIATI